MEAITQMDVGQTSNTFSRLEELLRRGNDVARRKLEEKGVTGQTGDRVDPAPHSATLPPHAAEEVDQAYGAALALLSGQDADGTYHALDPDRVAALLDL